MERSNISAYEANLPKRLDELRKGDPAYKLHELVFMEAFVFATELHGDKLPQKILDAGCGLGFLTASLAKLDQKVIGIDISEKAIAMAKKEHKEIDFYVEPIESFSEIMSELGIERFDQVILNMVLHSVNDKTVLKILKGVRQCLKPEGTVLALVPTETWLTYKLIDYAQDNNMDRENGVAWVGKMLSKQKVELPVKIESGEYYPEPITIYNRSIDGYGELFRSKGFGVRWNSHDAKTEKLTSKQILPFVEINELYCATMELLGRDRNLLMSFAL